MQIATIGVFGWTLERFLAALHDAGVRVVLDVRQRRGVRGPEYAWANSLRLQTALEQDVGKRSRVDLAPAYRERYQREILDRWISMSSSASCATPISRR